MSIQVLRFTTRGKEVEFFNSLQPIEVLVGEEHQQGRKNMIAFGQGNVAEVDLHSLQSG
jgi:hypothetical protein